MSMRDWVQTLGARVQPKGEAAAQSKPTLESRARGDRARDERKWQEAAEAYQIYLADAPHDTAIWVQLGHALKEAGRHDEAEVAYRQALLMTPDDADLLLNLGHLMKLRGRKHEASKFYESATLADPTTPAYRELLALGEASRAERALLRARSTTTTGKTYFQIDDLLIYFSGLRTVSGIQRVVIEFMRFILEQPSTPGERYLAFVHADPVTAKLLEAPKHLIRDLVYYLDETNVDQFRVTNIVDNIKSNSVAAVIGEDCCFMMLGAFWGVDNNSTVLAMLKSAGVTIGAYFYDLIPIDYPEFCNPELVSSFSQSFVEALCYVDFACAISDFSARSVTQFMAKHGFASIPVSVVKLAHSFSAAREPATFELPLVPAQGSTISFLRNREFVMCVGTIEARKNHKYLFEVWKLLIAEGIPVPQLVFVGRHGWRVNEFFEQLKSTRYLGGKVTVLHDITDRELAALYRQCQFTVFTSLAEGWGLPVGESLSYGKVCVAATTSSLQEVGGNLIPYVDPLNVRDGFQVIKRLITEPDYLKGLEEGIADNFVPRTWTHVGREILDCVRHNEDRHQHVQRKVFVPLLEPCVKMTVGDFSPHAAVSMDAKLRTKRLALNRAWHRPEGFGAWMDGVEGTILFATKLPPGTDVVVFLEIVAPPLSDNNALVLTGPGGKKLSCELKANNVFTVRLFGPCDIDSRVRIDFRVVGNLKNHSNDARKIGVGLVSLVWVAADDGLGRMEILERFLFDQHIQKSSKYPN